MKPPEDTAEMSGEQLACAFPFLPEPQRDLLLPHIELQRVEAGGVLFAVGDPADAVYVVLEGRLAVKKRTNFGKSGQVIALLAPGAPVGEASAAGGGERSADVVAVEDSLVCRLPVPALRKLQTDNPEIAIALLKHLLTVAGLRLEKCSERLAHIL